MDYEDYISGQTNENFWFKAKIRLIDVLMSKACSSDSGRQKILNIGAGTGGDLEVLSKYGDNYVVDINKNAINLIDSRFCLEKTVADACDLPYKSGFFDIAVCFDVFEHIKDDSKAVNEIFRVLKNNGTLVFIVPAFQSLFSSHDRALSHHRRYNLREVKIIFRTFKDMRIYYWNSALFLPVAAMRLAKKNSIQKVDNVGVPGIFNRIFYSSLMADNMFITHEIPIPVGLTIAGFCKKQ